MARVFAILVIFAAVAAVTLSIPRDTNEIEDIPPAFADEVVGIPTDAILKALEESQPSNGRVLNNLFNISAYLNDPRRPNGTALTFIPLVTLLIGLTQGQG